MDLTRTKLFLKVVSLIVYQGMIASASNRVTGSTHRCVRIKIKTRATVEATMRLTDSDDRIIV